MASILRLNTRLFLNCFEGVSDEKARERPNPLTNNLAFLGCHLVDSRHFLATQLGLDEVNPFAEQLASVQSIDEMDSFPSVAEIRSAWRALAPVLEACVAGLTPSELRAASPARFPVDDPSVNGMLAFLIQHESYHIGQIALIRKHHGYAAMKY